MNDIKLADELTTWSKRLLCEALMQNGEDKAAMLAAAMRASMAGWVLMEATTPQVLEIYDRYKPSRERN